MIFQLSLRQFVGWRRLGFLLFLLGLAALPVLISAVLVEAARLDPELMRKFAEEWFRKGFLTGLFDAFQLPLLYPIMALILAATVLREEIQSETIVYLWTKPVGRWEIVISKYAAALAAALLLSSLSLMFTEALIISDWGFIGKLLLTMALALSAYGAFFFALSVIFERALIWGFVYVLGWEESFSRISPAASQLSIRHYAEGFEKNLLNLPSEVSLAMSLGVLLGLTVVLLGLAIWRFSRLEFAGSVE